MFLSVRHHIPLCGTTHETEARFFAVFVRFFHHFDCLFPVHRRNHKSILKRAERRQLVDFFGLFARAVGFAKHAVGRLAVDVAHRFGAAMPAHRLLFCQRVPHNAFVAGTEQIGEKLHRDPRRIDVVEQVVTRW